jgi:hypothetical protein
LSVFPKWTVDIFRMIFKDILDTRTTWHAFLEQLKLEPFDSLTRSQHPFYHWNWNIAN